MKDRVLKQPAGRDRFSFASPASTSLDELVQLRSAAQALQRHVRKKSLAPLSGGSVSRRLGRGLDFAEVREYQPGDDVRMIDWKVTARSGHAHTKLFVEERERPVLLVVDFRACMRFGTRGMYKSVLAARLAALLGWSVVAGHDRVGGFVFTDDWHDEIRPQAGRRGLMALFRAIHHSQQRIPQVEGDQLAACLGRLRRGAHTGSTVVLLSDFQGFNDAARSALGSVVNTMDLLAVHISDPLEKELPAPGRYPMQSNDQDNPNRMVMTVKSRADQQRYLEQYNERQAAIQSLLSHNRHFYTSAMTDAPLLETAARILSRQATNGSVAGS